MTGTKKNPATAGSAVAGLQRRNSTRRSISVAPSTTGEARETKQCHRTGGRHNQTRPASSEGTGLAALEPRTLLLVVAGCQFWCRPTKPICEEKGRLGPHDGNLQRGTGFWVIALYDYLQLQLLPNAFRY